MLRIFRFRGSVLYGHGVVGGEWVFWGLGLGPSLRFQRSRQVTPSTAKPSDPRPLNP